MKMIFFALWGLSLLLMLAAAAQLWRAFVRKKEEITRALANSLGLLLAASSACGWRWGCIWPTAHL